MIAYFYNKTTQEPWTGLSPTVSILNASTNTVVVNNQLMTELSLPGWYSYDYTLNTEMDYAVNYNPNNTNYFYSVDKMKEKQTVASGGGVSSWYVNNFSGSFTKINNQLENILKEVKQYIDDAKNEILNKEEKEIDFSSILDKIDCIEMPDMKEMDMSPMMTKMDSFWKDLKEIKKIAKYDYSKDIEEAVKEKEQEMNDNFEKTKEEIFNDANEIIKILEEENIQVKTSLKNKIITSLSE